MLPPVDPQTGLLPEAANPYASTLTEVHDRFVVGAPFQERRQLLFDALTVYAELIWSVYPDARLRLDGGFITLKAWGEPKDIDIAVVCPTISATQRDTAVGAGLFTIKDATGVVHRRNIPSVQKLQPFGGLIDSFYVPEKDHQVRQFFEDFWARETGPDKKPTGRRKGYVEVVNPHASH